MTTDELRGCQFISDRLGVCIINLVYVLRTDVRLQKTPLSKSPAANMANKGAVNGSIHESA